MPSFMTVPFYALCVHMLRVCTVGAAGYVLKFDGYNDTALTHYHGRM